MQISLCIVKYHLHSFLRLSYATKRQLEIRIQTKNWKQLEHIITNNWKLTIYTNNWNLQTTYNLYKQLETRIISIGIVIITIGNSYYTYAYWFEIVPGQNSTRDILCIRPPYQGHLWYGIYNLIRRINKLHFIFWLLSYYNFRRNRSGITGR